MDQRQFQDPFYPPLFEPEFLPPGLLFPLISRGMAAGWVDEHTQPGDWILDPFCTSPGLVLEAARTGRKVLTACASALVRRAIEIRANLPKRELISSLINDLLSAHRGPISLEEWLRKQYETTCPSCGNTIQVDGFLWRRNEEKPFARLIRCPKCKENGERALSPEDLEKIPTNESLVMHRARAFERLGAENTIQKETAEKLISMYSNRAVDVLFTLINKVEGFQLPPEKHRLLEAVLLTICVDGLSVFPYPAVNETNQPVVTPPVWLEKNLYYSLQTAAALWSEGDQPVEVTFWPKLPSGQSGICIFPGRIRRLAEQKEHLPHFAGVLSMAPRPEPASWQLSALFNGWVFGREAAAPHLWTLERRRWDLAWHSQVLAQSFSTLQKIIHNDCSGFLVLPSPTPGATGALLIALHEGNLGLTSLSICEDPAILQVIFNNGSHKKQQAFSWQEDILPAMRQVLLERGEPAPGLMLQAAALMKTIQFGALPAVPDKEGASLTAVVVERVQSLIKDETEFCQVESPNGKEKKNKYWLVKPEGNLSVLPELVEEDVRTLLPVDGKITRREILQKVFGAQRGFCTPDIPLVETCLESYGELVDKIAGAWSLRPEEESRRRAADVVRIREDISLLGRRTGFDVRGDDPIEWVNAGGDAEYTFFVMTACNISETLLNYKKGTSRNPLLIIPGGRAGLLLLRLARDGRLGQHWVDCGWRAVKFRLIRQAAARESLDGAGWAELLESDPLHAGEAFQLKIPV